MHRAEWPIADELSAHIGSDADAGLLDLVGSALIGIRGAKTAAKASQKTEVSLAIVHAPAAQASRIEYAADDLRAVGRIAELRIEPADVHTVTVASIELVPTEN